MEEVKKSMHKPEQSNYCVEVMSQLNALRYQANFCDVTLVVEETEFKAHKSVLSAASPYFNKMFTSDMQEKEKDSVRLEELPVSVMGYILDYIYTGDVEVTGTNAHQLLASANYLLLPGLKTLAGEFLAQNLDISNSIATYYFAVKYKCDELLHNSREFINSKFNSVSESNDFLALSQDQVKEWLSSDDIIISAEKDAFKAMLRWIKNDESGEREKYFLELFRTIRLTSVGRDYLFNDVLENSLVRDNPKCIELVLDAMREVAHASGEYPPRKKPRKCLEMHVDTLVAVQERSTLCYIPSNGCSYKLADALSGQNVERVTSCRGCLYSVGDSGKQSAQRYDPLVNSWSSIKEPPENLVFFVLTALQGFMYQIGGKLRGTLQRVDSVYRYDPDTNSWQQVAPLSVPRSSVCAVADDKHVYALGGRTDATYSDTVERFEPGSNTWTPLASMPEGKAAACGVALGENIFVLGGTQDNASTPLSTCEMYNCTTNQWQAIPSMHVPRRFAGAAAIGDTIYVFGGTRDPEYLDKFELYHLQKNEWENQGKIVPINGYQNCNICALRLSRTVLESASLIE